MTKSDKAQGSGSKATLKTTSAKNSPKGRLPKLDKQKITEGSAGGVYTPMGTLIGSAPRPTFSQDSSAHSSPKQTIAADILAVMQNLSITCFQYDTNMVTIDKKGNYNRNTTGSRR